MNNITFFYSQDFEATFLILNINLHETATNYEQIRVNPNDAFGTLQILNAKSILKNQTDYKVDVNLLNGENIVRANASLSYDEKSDRLVYSTKD